MCCGQDSATAFFSRLNSLVIVLADTDLLFEVPLLALAAEIADGSLLALNHLKELLLPQA